MIKIREIKDAAHQASNHLVSLQVERRVLAKRRWRGEAEDGTEFGFDLALPLKHGICFHRVENKNYLIKQKVEKVFRVSFSNQKDTAHLAWQVGNLHSQLNSRIPTFWSKATWQSNTCSNEMVFPSKNRWKYFNQ